MKLKFFVEGMTCAVCSASVERVCLRVEGVRSAAVNLSAKTLIVECEKNVRPEAIVSKIEAAGFSAVLQTEERREEQAGKTAEKKALLFSFSVFLPLFYLSMAGMLSLPLPTFAAHGTLFNALLQLGLCLAVLWINRGFFVRGFLAVRRKSANMDTLVSMGSAASFLYSVFSLLMFATAKADSIGHLYFDSAAMILVLVRFGKFLEERAKERTAADLNALRSALPQSARVLRDGEEVEISPAQIKIGDSVVLRPGESLSVDGVVTDGQSTLDVSRLTGESLPVDAVCGTRLLSGSINLSGRLVVRAEKPAGESTLSQMIDLVQEAGGAKAPAAKLADRIASVFVPTVFALSCITFALWMVFEGTFATAFSFAVSVLVVSCPCALGLATPVAVTAALGRCAARGVLVRTPEVFETLVRCDTVLLDKTGTITRGVPEVTDVFCAEGGERLLELAASLEEASEHPLARAVCRFVDLPRVKVEAFESVFGRGVRARCEGKELLGGNAAFLQSHSVDLSPIAPLCERAEQEGKTLLYFAFDHQVLGALALTDEVKPTSRAAVARLKEKGKHVVMLTGDRASVARRIADECGIEEVKSALLPQEKQAEVLRLQQKGHRVLMVGDGINDAPSLAHADVGAGVGNGTDIAKNAADVIFLNNDLLSVSRLFDDSALAQKIIRQNLFWAFFYNCCMIPVAAGAFYKSLGLSLSPMVAAGCMCVSSLIVVTNALRLQSRKEKSHETDGIH